MYYLRIYPDTTTSGTPNTILEAGIYGVDLGDRRYSNDNPFEIVGNQANLSIINLPRYQAIFTNLERLEILYSGTTYKTDYFQNLVQVISSQTGAPVFTGLIRFDSLRYDVKDDSLELTLCDSLDVFISLNKLFARTSYSVDSNNLDTFFGFPLSLLSAPLANVTVNYNNDPIIVSDIDMQLEGYERSAAQWYYYDVWDNPHQYDYDDWARVAQSSCVYQRLVYNGTRTYISFWVTFARRGTGSTSLLSKYYVAEFSGDNWIQPISTDTGVLGASGSTLNVAYGNLTDDLKAKRCLPSAAAFNLITVTAYYGEQFEFTETASTASWNVDTFLIDGDQTITLNQPNYGRITATLDLNVGRMYFDEAFANNNKALAVLTLWLYSMSAKPVGGIDIFPSLLRNIDSGTPEVIPDSDVVEFSARGTFIDNSRGAESISAFENSATIQSIVEQYQRQFFDRIRTTYTITLPKSYANHGWQGFEPITVRGITMYIYKWQIPTLDDTITIEAIGGYV